MEKAEGSSGASHGAESGPPVAGKPVRPPRPSGKAKGWVYLRSAEDVRLALNRVLNLMLVGDTRAKVDPGMPPPKIDPQAANAAANILRTWLTAHSITHEKKLDEVMETNEMLLKLLEDRGIDVSGGGSRNH
jgi:hypothetical protein